MRIIKVIVDEFPRACINCGYGHLKDDSYCTLSQCRRIDINPYISKPDWCPLITGEELLWLVQSPFTKMDDYSWESEE